MSDVDQAPAQASFRKLFITSTVLLVAAAAIAAFLMLQAFVSNLAPEIELKAAMVGRSISAEVDRALKLGIPFDRLHGMDAFLDRVLSENADIAFVSVTDPTGHVSFVRARGAPGAERTSKAPGESGVRKVDVPIDAAAPARGTVTLGISRTAIDARTYAVVFDMAIVLLVAGLFAFELLSLVFQVSIAGPLARLWAGFQGAAGGDFTTRVAASGQREWEAVASAWNDMVRRLAEAWQQVMAEAQGVRATLAEAEASRRLGRLIEEARARFAVAEPSKLRAISASQAIAVRAPVFVFIMAEEFSRAFLPVFIRGLREPGSALSPELAVGIPMTAFMAMVAIVTPFAGALVSRLGVRRMFMLGIAPSAIGYLGTAFAGSIWELVLWRALAGAGYAIVYIVCQGFVATASSPQKRAQGMALFMGAVFAAGVCGPALGGVVADQIGPRLTFIVSTGLCLMSLGLMYAQLRDMREAGSAPPQLRLRDFGVMLRNPSFVALLVLAAMPAKIALTGFLFYLSPLLLSKLGNSSSEIGRVMMIYAGCTALLTPVAARIADRWHLNGWMISVGGVISGAGLLGILVNVDTGVVVVAVLLLGLGHSVAIAPQLAVVPEIAAREAETLGVTAVLAVFRAIERLGSVIGPLLAAVLVRAGGEPLAMATIGALVVVASLSYAVFGRPAPGLSEART